MAVVTVAADNVRIAEANIVADTGTWGNDGGGGGVSDEPDFYYQGNTGALTSQSRKVSTSPIGRSYTHGSGTDMTATGRRHTIYKIQATNKDALNTRTTPAFWVKNGSGSGAYYEHYLFGSENYPKRGGWQIIAVSPNVAGYRDATTGSPTLTSVLYWSLVADFAATSKSENIMIDAIDIGRGLTLTGGDGGDADGVYANFVSADEGTLGNSWGFVYSEGNAIFVTGRLAIGENTSGTAVATVFIDSDKKLEWTNGLVETGFHAHRFNLGNASTVITLTRCSYDSNGQQNNTAGRSYTTTEDSRVVFEVVGTAGSFSMINGSISNAASITLTDSCTFDAVTIINSGQINCGTGTTGPDLTGTAILVSAVAADSSSLLWNINADPDGNLDDMRFTKGTNAHHAIEFGTSSPTSMTLRGIDFSGFNATTGQNDSTFYIKRTVGTVTINLVDVTSDVSLTNSFKTDGATVIIQSTVTLTVNVEDQDGAPIEDVAVWMQRTSPTAYTSGVGNTAGGSSLVVTQTINSDTPQSSKLTVLDISENSTLPYRFQSWSGSTFTLRSEVTGSATSTDGTNPDTRLISTTTNFTTADIEEGDTIRNTTDGSYAVVDRIIDADNINTSILKGGTNNEWRIGDSFSVHRLATALVSGTDRVDVPYINSFTNASGVVTASINFGSSQPIIVKARKNSPENATRYVYPQPATGTITSNGVSINIVLQEDTVAT